MQLSIIALVSSEWGIARFTTDSFASVSLVILAAFPIILLKHKIELRSIWTDESALSKR